MLDTITTMARKDSNGHRRILPFRIPFFRIFYSTTYTILYIIELCLLAITPTSIIYMAVENSAYQYIFMVGGVYVLVVLLAIFIYSSRLYTNRTVLAGVGKAYVPVEEGEVSRSVRKMIVKQLERSAIVAWEARPRDLEGEILEAEKVGILPPDSATIGHNDYTTGRIINVDPALPPWGRVAHPGWASPSHRDDNKNPGIQFASVIAELPNLIEARAVSLAPPDPASPPDAEVPMADPAVVELLCRPEMMGMRDYLTQLGYLGLINPPAAGQTFLRQYENARFCGRPISEAEFGDLMASFSVLLSGMIELQPAIIEQIRAQTADNASVSDAASTAPSQAGSTIHHRKSPTPLPPSPGSGMMSPVTAREAPSRITTPYLQQEMAGSSTSVIVRTPMAYAEPTSPGNEDAESASLPSDTGSVVIHSNG